MLWVVGVYIRHARKHRHDVYAMQSVVLTWCSRTNVSGGQNVAEGCHLECYQSSSSRRVVVVVKIARCYENPPRNVSAVGTSKIQFISWSKTQPVTNKIRQSPDIL